jgi:hypothetical protein
MLRPALDVLRQPPSDRMLRLFGQVRYEPRRARDEREAADAPGWDPDVGERGTSGARAIDRKGTAGRLLVHLGDELEQPEMWTEEMLFGRELVEARHARILTTVKRVTEARDALAGSATRLDRRLANPAKRVVIDLLLPRLSMIRERVDEEACSVAGRP